VLFAIGDLASEAADSFGAAGQRVADIEAARTALDPLLASDTTVLVKGSRVMGLDRLVRTLESEPRAS
jgi:UDP-N-acetylmuramoyl-tripeptide--D-alanyl-D-alanine ligase